MIHFKRKYFISIFYKTLFFTVFSFLLFRCGTEDEKKGEAQLVVSKAQLKTTESGGSDSFNVGLSYEPEQAVKIKIQSSNLLEGKPNKENIEFTSSN